MEITTASCNKCGAALELPASAHFVTCHYCGAQLEVHRTESAVTTEVLTRIDRRTTEIAEDVGALRHAQEIEQLDREWQLRRDSLLTRNKYGSTSEPSTTAGLITIFAGGGFGLFWTIFTFSMTSSSGHSNPSLFPNGMPMPPSAFPHNDPPLLAQIFPLFGIIFIIAAVVGGLSLMSKATTFQKEQADYERRRAQLLNQNRNMSP